MDNVDLDVLRQVCAWRQQQPVVLGTITSTWGSAPRPAGALVAVRADGQIAGSVSGGCIEDDLVARVRSGALAAHGVERVRYGISGDEAARFGLPCGGTLELLLEPLHEASRVEELLAALERGERVRRELRRADGVATLTPALGADVLQLDDERLVTTHGPHWRLFIVGAGQMSQYLARMALALDYQVTVCDPREEYRPELPGVTLTQQMPDDAVRALAPDAHTAVIALTHDPKLDDLALMEALRSEAFYVGAIGSRANQARRKQRLAEHFGFTEAELAPLYGPVGLKNGARTPPEIAVSILAELTAARYGWRIPEPVFVGRGATAAST
ncbi:MAG: XdhC family protein [Rubrivivax sp.]|nr:XdhC family protein [Rubrivivax sp.]